MSAKDTAPADGIEALGSRTAGAADDVGADVAGLGVIVPATTRPMRNATVAARETLTARNRRVMVEIIIVGSRR